MTELAPFYIESTQVGAGVALPTDLAGGSVTLTSVGAVAGDLCVIVQDGNAASGSRVAPLVGSTAGRFTEVGPIGTTTGNGRVDVYWTLLISADLSQTINMNTTTWTNHRCQIFLIHADEGFPTNPVVTSIQSSANTGNDTAINFAATASSFREIAVGGKACISSADLTADTWTWDGGTARAPYVDESSTQTTTGAHGDHFGDNSTRSNADWNGYDKASTPVSVTCHTSMGNTSHAIVTVLFKANLAVSTASEVDTAQVIGHERGLTVGVASEVDTAQTIGKVQGVKFANTAPEIDTAQVLAASKKQLLGTASEVDTALSLHQHLLDVGVSNEIDTAQTLAPLKSWADQVSIDNPTSTQVITSISLTASKNYPLDSGDIRIALYHNSVEYQVSGWVALSSTPTVQTLNLSTAVGGSNFAIWWEVRTGGQLDPIISDVGALTINVVGTASEIDGANVIARFPYHPALSAFETDTALPVGHYKTRTIGVASEVDTARVVPTHASAIDIGTAFEFDIARSVTGIVESDEKTPATFHSDQRATWHSDQRASYKG